jgi:outer membrane autotransporter protein
MKKTIISLAVSAAITILSGQTLAQSIMATNDGENEVTETGENIELRTPSSGFYIDEAENTKMFTLVTAQGNGTTKANTVTIGDESTQTVVLDGTANLNQNGWISTTAVYAQGAGAVVDIRANESVSIISNDIGVMGQSNTQDATRPENAARVTIQSRDVSITADNQAVMAFSNSTINISATNNIYIQGASAIDTRGNSLININADNQAQRVTLIGDVVFETPNAPGDAQNSGNIINSEVNINLTSAESSWTGRAYQYYRVQNGDGTYTDVENVELNADPYVGNVTDFVLNMSNGATWTVTGDSFVNTANVSEGSSIILSENAEALNAQTVALNDGTISLQSTQQRMSVNSLSGTGGTVNVATSANNGGGFTTATLTVGSVDSTDGTLPSLAVKYTGINADDLTNPEADMKTLGEQSIKLTEGEHIAQVRTVEEGDIRGSVTQTVDEVGKVTGTTTAANVKLADYSSLNAMSLVQWRNEINHLTKRLGDIRAAEGTIGAWARVYGGESQWGGGNEVEMDHTTIQVGGDYRVNNHWIVGGAFSYTDSDADLAKGAATGDSYSLAAYATYMADGGSFLDLIARYGYLKNDIDSGNMSLETGSSAFSLTAEMGHTFRFMEERAYIEPQVEFTYGFVSGDDDTASNGVKIEQDDFQSFVTRIGVRTGFDFPKKAGTIYGMVSYSYDFLGDADGMASEGNLRQALSEDLGGGWVSYGIGAQVMFGKSSYFYGELERTSGGEVDNPYLFNAGVRITF